MMQTSNRITVDVDAKGRFSIDCPFKWADRVRRIPARFNKTNRVWLAPVLRGSIRGIEKLRQLPGAEVVVHPKAQAAIDGYEESLRPSAEGFPAGYSFKTTPMEQQTRALEFAWPRKGVAFDMEMGCLAGDTVIRMARAGSSHEMTIAELYAFSQRNPNTHLTARCLAGGESPTVEDSFIMNDIEKVWKTGVKECIEVVLDDGKKLVCTYDHKLLTAKGWVEAQNLSCGEEVLVNGKYAEKDKEFRTYEWSGGFIDKNGYRRVFVPRHPRSNLAGAVYEHILVMEKQEGRWVTSADHVHHLNGNKSDNRIENLLLLDKVEHLKQHGPQYRRNLDGGTSPVSSGKVVVIPKTARVVSISTAGFRDTYDLTMKEPHQNYVANGIVVHNTGKTKVAIDIAAASFLGGETNQFFVVCPASIMSTWVEEIQTHCPCAATVGVGIAPKAKPGALRVMIVSVEGLGISKGAFEAAAAFVREAPTNIAIDESSRIKEQSAKRSQHAHLLALNCVRRMILNGTLIGNSPLDLWSQYEAVDPKIIGQPWFDFRAYYAEFGGFEGRQVIGYKNMQELIETVAPYTFTVKKSEVMKDLPPKTYQIRRIKPSANQSAAIKAIKQKPLFVMVDEKKVKTEMALERMMRIQQVAAGLVSYIDEKSPEYLAAFMAGKKPQSTVERIEGGNPKIRELLALLEEFEGKAIIWCKFTEEIHWIKEELDKVYGPKATVLFYGQDPLAQDEARHRLQNDPLCRFFVGNIASGAIGITLTAATLMVYMTNTFSWLDRAQSEDRFHRKGQTKSTTVVDILMEGTIDETCLNILRDKKDMAEYVSSEINAANLRNLIGA